MIVLLMLFCSVVFFDMSLTTALVSFWVVGVGLTLPQLIAAHRDRALRHRQLLNVLIDPQDYVIVAPGMPSAIAEARIEYSESPEPIQAAIYYDSWIVQGNWFNIEKLTTSIVQREAEAQETFRFRYSHNTKLIWRIFAEANILYALVATTVVYTVQAFGSAGQPYASMDYWGPLLFAVLACFASIVAIPWWSIMAVSRYHAAAKHFREIAHPPHRSSAIRTRYRATRKIPLPHIATAEMFPHPAREAIFATAFRLDRHRLPDDLIEYHLRGIVSATLRRADHDALTPAEDEHRDPRLHQQAIIYQYFQDTPPHPE